MRSIRDSKLVLLAVVAPVAVLSSCGGDDGPDLEAAVDTYADGVHASYAASLASATAMDEAVDAFVAAPSDATLESAKQAWLDARDDYGLTEAFRFYGGPIDNEEDGPEGLINAWPMDEAYVDYVEGDPEAGIINDPATYPTIDAELLASLNESGGETNISTGWHAIEFLLWGQDLSEDGPGARPCPTTSTPPTPIGAASTSPSRPICCSTHLQALVDAWSADTDGNYRGDVPRARSRGGDDQHHHRHRRAQPRRAGRRAHERRLHAAFAGGRALVLLRQHHHRPRRQRQRHPDGARWPAIPTASRARACST